MSHREPLTPSSLPGPVWVVSPHPDDEALGCGGLIAALSGAGQEVWVLLLSDGGLSHPNSQTYPRERLAGARLAEWRAGLAELGVPGARTRALGLPDGELHACAGAIAGGALAAFREAPPGTLLLPWARDPHPDHRAAWAPLLSAARAFPAVRRLAYTVWLEERGESADHPRPGETRPLTLDVRPWLAPKRRAILAHRTQLGLIADDPHGFTLPATLVERALSGTETYHEVLTQEVPA
ncbi:PIG-L family deacetylase [Deinococcus sp. SDU3-2]|uniref:PIG-L family deacetylase n=1 Tax=Deinococcus terrestris TaxID=2651870 RepID=A0A7X1TS20_9DEIO|nr:PIG-L deacetylase family protein [Deinococcus terrestris]MPY67345.1 PIG-L family deacetylase [Deinococcus terrestris]